MPSRHVLPLVLLALGRAAAAGDAAPTAAVEPDAARSGNATAVAEVPAIDASEAADHLGEECVVEMVVRAARLLADKHICFLNARQERRDAGNFTVVIFRRGLERFREADVEDPAAHFLDRTIRVHGVVAEHKGQPQIVVDEPEQIELVEEPEAAAAETE